MAEVSTTQNKLNKVDLFPLFLKGIARQYPESEGWKVYNRFNWVSYLHDFVLQREGEKGTERVVVEVVTDRRIREENIVQLKEMATRLEHDGTKVSRTVVVLSDDTDSSGIPVDIEAIYLSDFLRFGLNKHISSPTGSNGGDQDKLVA